jgi:hypothetical protein
MADEFRSPQGVIEAIISVIPDAALKEEVRANTRSTLDSVRYTAPEIMGERWAELTHDLSSVMQHLPNTETSTEWFLTTVKIFNGELDYRDYLDLETLPA